MNLKFISIVICLVCKSAFSQIPFAFTSDEAGNHIIVDCASFEEQYYALEILINSEEFPKVIVLDNEGTLLKRFTLQVPDYRPLRILNVLEESIILFGKFTFDSCTSVVAVVEYDFDLDDFTVLSSVDFCNENVQNLKFVKGMNNDMFVQGYYVGLGWNGFLLKFDSAYHIERFVDSIGHLSLSVDFSRKGYILRNDDECYFYDRDFQQIKEKYSFTEGVSPLHQTCIPYSNNYILENFGGSIDFEDYGQHLRVIDSNLAVKNHVVIPSVGIDYYIGEIAPAFFGGISIMMDSGFIVVGNNNITSDLTRPTHFSVSNLNYELEVECTQYVGFDAFYRMFGFTKLEQGGIAIYGTKFQDSYDSYLMVLGPNCELPTSTVETSTVLNSIKVYPNPTNDVVHFDFTNSNFSDLNCDFYDSNGLHVLHSNNLANGVSVRNLPAGQYFYKIILKDTLMCTGAWVKN